MLKSSSTLNIVQKLRSASSRLHSNAARSSTSIDSKEVEKFGELSTDWANETGPFQALHSLNRIRVPWILGNIPKPKTGTTRLVDVGSGGGILSIPLARSGLDVTGIDATKEAVQASTAAMNSKSLANSGISQRLRFQHTSVEDFCQKPENNANYDAVVASEILEHVADLSSFIQSLAAMAKPGAPLFLTTINRTMISKVAAIWLAEDILRIVPQGVHEWEKFITPEELRGHLESAGCRVQSVQGTMFHPIGNRWTWIGSTQCNYAMMAIKK